LANWGGTGLANMLIYFLFTKSWDILSMLGLTVYHVGDYFKIRKSVRNGGKKGWAVKKEVYNNLQYFEWYWACMVEILIAK